MATAYRFDGRGKRLCRSRDAGPQSIGLKQFAFRCCLAFQRADVFTKAGKVFRIFGNIIVTSFAGAGERSGLAGAHFPFARTGADVFVKGAGQIVLSRISNLVGDLLDRKVTRPQQLLRSIHPKSKQHALRRNAKNFAEAVPERIMAGI